jgi:hypothetical protein
VKKWGGLEVVDGLKSATNGVRNMFRQWQLIFLLLIVAQASPPPLVLSPSRLSTFEKHTSTRQNAQYKITIANVLLNGKLKKRAEYFASSQRSVVSILIALLDNRDSKEDLAVLLNATAGHRVARQSLQPDQDQLEHQDHLYPSHQHHNLYAHVDKACMDFKHDHLNESVIHSFVQPDQHLPDALSSRSTSSDGFKEEEQYSLKRCLTVRGISVHKLLSPEVKRDIKAESPGSIEYRRSEFEPVSFVECGGRTAAYAAAW